MAIFLGILYFILGSASLYFFAFKNHPKLKIWSVLLFASKIGVGAIFYYIYAYHYSTGTLSGDTAVYHADSMVLMDLFKENSDLFWKVIFGQDRNVPALEQFYQQTHHWEFSAERSVNDARNFVRFNALLGSIGRGYYFVHTILYCLISTWAAVFLYSGILKFMKEAKLRSTLLMFFLPSIIFWTSGLMKESLLFIGLALFINALLAIAKKEHNWRTALKLIIGLVFLYFIKVYVLYCLIIPVICFSICLAKPNWSKIKVYGTAVFGLFLMFLLWDRPVDVLTARQNDTINISCGELIFEDDSSYYYVEQKYRNNFEVSSENEVNVLKETPAKFRKYFSKDTLETTLTAFKNQNLVPTMIAPRSGSYFEMAQIKNNKWTMFKNLPFAINNVIFRPFPWDGNIDIYKILAFIENVFVFALILFAWRGRVRYQERTIKNIISFFLFFTTLLYALIGQTTPVAGAIMRYKTPGLFLLMAVATLLLYGYNKEHEAKKAAKENQ